MNAYEQGIEAYKSNRTSVYNPYVPGSEDYFDWENGWEDAKDEHTEAVQLISECCFS